MRNKPSTNEFYRSVLDNALREQFTIQKPDVHRAKQERSRRLSSLYGYSMSSAVVRERMGKGRKTEHSDTANARRTMTPYKDDNNQATRRLTQTKSADKVGLFRPSVGLLGIPDQDHSSTSVPGVKPLSASSASSQPNTSETIPAVPFYSVGEEDIPSEDSSSDESKGDGRSPTRRKKLTSKQRGAKGRRKQGQPSAKLTPSHTMPDHQNAAPWYFGYQNSSNIPTYSPAAQRYGYSGTLNITRSVKGLENRSIIDYGITSLTLKNSLPRFMGEDMVADEFVPQVHGPPRNWTVQATYVTGSKLKPKQEAPELPEHVKKDLDKMNAQVDELNKHVIEERRKDAAFRASMSQYYNPVQIDEATGRPKNEKNKLIREGKKMRYWNGMTAVFVNAEKEADVEVTIAKEKEHRIKMRELKWSESFYLYKLLRSMSMQLKPGLEEFRSLLSDLKASVQTPGIPHTTPSGVPSAATGMSATSSANEDNGQEGNAFPTVDRVYQREESKASVLSGSGSGTSQEKKNQETLETVTQDDDIHISREVFVNLMCGHFEHADRRRMNKLYSSFDPDRLDQVDYRLVLVAQRCFWRQNESSSDKLRALLNVMDQHRGTNVLSFEEVRNLFLVCSVLEEERDRMEMHLQDTRPYFMAHTVLSPPGYIHVEEFERLLTMYGRPERHPLVQEFFSQVKQRVQGFLLNGTDPSAPAPTSPGTGTTTTD